MEQKYFYEAFQELFAAVKDILCVYQKEEFYRLLFRCVYELSGDEMYDNDSIRKVTSGGQTIHLRAVKQLCTDTGFELLRKEIERHITKIEGIDAVVDSLLKICKNAEEIPTETTRQIEDSLGGHTAYQLSRGIAAILVCLNQADYNKKRKKNLFPDTGFMQAVAEKLFLEGETIQYINLTIDGKHISERTVAREKKRAIAYIAQYMDSYFAWEVECCFL